MGKKTAKRWTDADAEKVLSDAEHSGLDDRQFAKQCGLDPQRLWWWRKRLGRVRSKPEQAPAFIEVHTTPPQPVPAQMLEVWLANGRSVMVPASIDTARLAKLLEAIEGSGC